MLARGGICGDVKSGLLVTEYLAIARNAYGYMYGTASLEHVLSVDDF